MKKLLLLSFSVVCAFLLAGCGGGSSDNSAGSGAPTSSGSGGGAVAEPDSGTGDGGSSKGVIGVSLLTLDNPFFKVIGDNITSEAKKHGYETLVVSADKDLAKQSNQVKDFIVKQCAAVVLSPVQRKSIVPVIQELNEAGIPVFTVDIPCNEPGVKIVCQIATDNYSGGKEAGRAMIEAMGEAGGKVAVLHFKQAESCQLRVKGFTEVIEEHNKTAKRKIEVVTTLESGGAKDEGFKATQDALQAHADIRGIFAINDPAALGARASLENISEAKANSVKIIGFDGQPEGKQAIKEGRIYADPIQFPDKMGVEIVKAFISHLKGDEVPAEILIPTALYRQADGEKDPELK